MNDVFGFGKILPIDKLIEIIASVTGRLSKSYFDRKDVDTKSYEIKKLAEARAEEMKIISSAIQENLLLTGGIEYKESNIVISARNESLSRDINQNILVNPTLEERTKERLLFQDAKKQLNIESITAYAADELKNATLVTDEPIDDNWKTRFFNIAEDISGDEMQAVQGRILAGEIIEPKSYSLRTLELLKNLDKNEAECFLKFGKLAISSSNRSFVIDFKGEKLLEEKYNLTFDERLLLEELGLLTANDLQYEIYMDPDKIGQVVFKIGNICMIAKIKKGTSTISISVLVFTKIGEELLQLIETSPELEYIQLFTSKIRNDSVSVRYGNIPDNHIEEINYSHLIDVPLTEEEELKLKEDIEI